MKARRSLPERLCAVASLLALMALAACGGGTAADGETPIPVTGGNEVQVSLSEFQIDMPASVAAGPTTFTVSNDGTVEHNFEVEGEGIEEELASNLMPGESGTLELDLAAGTYEVYCPVEGHREQGMEVELTVTE